MSQRCCALAAHMRYGVPCAGRAPSGGRQPDGAARVVCGGEARLSTASDQPRTAGGQPRTAQLDLGAVQKLKRRLRRVADRCLSRLDGELGQPRSEGTGHARSPMRDANRSQAPGAGPGEVPRKADCRLPEVGNA
eukprot:6563733-Prymnesium_polylepis.1